MMSDIGRDRFTVPVTAAPARTFSEIDLVNTATADELLKNIGSELDARTGFAVATLNLDHVVKLRARSDFLAAYSHHTYVVADGHPIVWLRRIAGAPVDLVTGADLVDPLMALAARRGTPVAFLGSTYESLCAAAAILERRHPGLRIVAKVSPPFGLDPAGEEVGSALRTLSQAGAKLCLLSLGAPKQELVAWRGLTDVPGCGFVSIGAGLEFIAGHQRRAPRWMRWLALEWLWRLLSDPRRLAQRYLACFRVFPGLTFQALRLRRRD